MKRKILALFCVVLLIAAIVPVSVHAASTNVIVHYHRDDGEYDKWDVWAWSPDGAAYPFTDTDKFGAVAEIAFPGVQDNRVGFIVRTEAWEKDFGDDRFIDLTKGSEIWIFSGQGEFFYDPPAGYEPEAREFENLVVDFNYYRYDGNYNGLSLSLSGGEGASKVEMNLPLTKNAFGAGVSHSFGRVTDLINMKFTITSGTGEVVDYAEGGTLNLSKADESGKLTAYAMQGTGQVSLNPLDNKPAILGATIDDAHRITVLANIPLNTDKMSFTIDGITGLAPAADAGGTDENFGKLEPGYRRIIELVTEDSIDFSKQYMLNCTGFDPVPVTLGNVFDSAEFASLFSYSGNDLGATYSKDKTKFVLWAPTAAEANVLLYEAGRVVPNVENEHETIAMTRGQNGTWVAEAAGDIKGKFYTYQVLIGGELREAVDPYAKAVGVNGMRGQVIDYAETNPSGWENDKRPELTNPTDAIIYELHVRDLSTQEASGITNKGKFLGIAETGTRSPDGEKTGLDHILDLGATHVHLLPSYDYKTVNEMYPEDNQFNWGYDPQNYNAPEGSYSTDPWSGDVRVAEFKQMVKSLHDNNVGVVMDVVYNHVYDANAHSFQQLVPGYYFRFKPDGTYSNGSGCGNETASERAMMRKYMVDSVVYWATEYHIDGFRFDLMGLHDIETMNLIRAELDKIDPSIMMYGEGWTGSSTTLNPDDQALKANVNDLDSRIAAFSDDIRDGIKGSVFNHTDPGYVNGNPQRVMDIKFGVVGSVEHPQVDISAVSYSDNFWANNPTQTISYASAHDNLSLWDKLTATNPDASDAELEAMNRLSAAIVLTSQGIPFFQAGEEMARTKKGDENSYKSSDSVNQLDWVRKKQFSDLFEYYKGLIALRKAYPAFRMSTGDDVRKNIEFFDTGSPTVIGYTIAANAGGGNNPAITVVFNGDNSAANVTLPQSGWDIVVNGEHAGTTPLETVDGVLEAKPKSAYVMIKSDAKPAEAVSTAQSTASTAPETAQTPSWVTAVLVILVLAVLGVVVFMLLRKKK